MLKRRTYEEKFKEGPGSIICLVFNHGNGTDPGFICCISFGKCCRVRKGITGRGSGEIRRNRKAGAVREKGKPVGNPIRGGKGKRGGDTV